jgi:molybdopterin synthase sulfur carrier subunit
MIVHVGSVLLGYTGGRADVEAEGASVGAVLDDLERRYPGLRFRVVDEQGRIRPHMRIYVGSEPAESLSRRVGPRDELHVLGALSGG